MWLYNCINTKATAPKIPWPTDRHFVQQSQVFVFCFVFSGIDTFKGTYFHSRDYKTPEEWRNKKVVVIGIGNSGGDIAVELSRVTKQVWIR